MRSSNKGETVAVAKIVGVHGVKGEVKAITYGDPAGVGLWEVAFVEIPAEGVHAEAGGEKERRRIRRARPHKGHSIVEIDGFQTRDDSFSLVGKEILINKENLPPLEKDEYYFFDLIGMEVFTEEGSALGRVTGIIETGSNDVLEVRGEHGEVLIPAIESVLRDVDANGRRITVRLLEGLLPEKKTAGTESKRGGERPKKGLPSKRSSGR